MKSPKLLTLAATAALITSASASVTYSPLIDPIYTDRREFTSISGVANANGGPVTTYMYFYTPVHVEEGPQPGIVSYSGGWAIANENRSRFEVTLYFSQPITTFSTNVQLNGDNGQSAVEIKGYLNNVLVSTLARSATNPVYGDQIDLTYTDVGGFDKLHINQTQAPNRAAYWGMQVNVSSTPPIPEPSIFVLGNLTLAAAVFRRRRRSI
jgi:hypothetical protein